MELYSIPPATHPPLRQTTNDNGTSDVRLLSQHSSDGPSGCVQDSTNLRVIINLTLH